MSTLTSILNRCISKPEKHILTLPCDGFFEKSLCKTGHTFYGDISMAVSPWNPNNLKLPDNFVMLNGRVPPRVDFDCVLINDMLTQLDKASQIASELHIPIVNFNHYDPGFFKREDLQKIRYEYRKIFANISISESARVGWQADGDIIGYETEIRPEHPKSDSVLLLGQFTQKDYYLVKEICQDSPSLVIIGDNPGLSRAGSIDDEDIALDNSKIYVNLLTYGKAPTNVFRALAAGCVVISTKTPTTEGLIIDGFNGFLVESTLEFRQAIDKVLKNPELASRISTNARNTIMSDFTTTSFVEKWNRVFDFASRSIFKR